MENIRQLLKYYAVIAEYISRYLENILGVMEYTPQLQHYFLEDLPKNWWEHYKNEIAQLIKKYFTIIERYRNRNTILYKR